ncbi:aminopeptidase [Intrasporangium calvum]|uniref:Aminopeptidase n=1 Tax=Intrasporangium calvum TaxID=53358 RepID=A0ABT5GFF6_9MICO|nr:aminopeptidase [Intrasporangium calvum]MDC5696967.1 aminopeptidase [Intrasporangium calvum]
MITHEPFDDELKAYAELVVRLGVNVQLGQRVVIRCHPEQAATARALATEAYRVGASRVSIDYRDQHLQRAQVEHAPEEELGRVLDHELAAARSWGEDKVALISLTGNPNPTIMEGLDPQRLARSTPIEFIKTIMPVMTTNQIAWTVVAAPSPGWAEAVTGSPDTTRLWEGIKVAMRLDQPDPAKSWQEHNALLHLRRDMLNARGFDRIRYRGPGTDLTMGLAPGNAWAGGSVTNADGVEFLPNLPTEEVFAAPDWRRVEGTIQTTAAFFLTTMNTLVEDLRLEVADGTITSATAARGEEAVRAQFDLIPRSRHFGEVAIVDKESAVRRSGLVYQDMLYDENIGSHVAWGAGYPFNVPGSDRLGPDERIQQGLNQANTHVDIVIGSPQVEIDGIDKDGAVTPITRGDTFVLPTA